MTPKEDKRSQVNTMPRHVLWVVLLLVVLPWILQLLGVDFSATGAAASGPLVHMVLEWTAFCIGAFVLLLALMHYGIRGDITIAIIGLALFGAGLLDALGTLAAHGLIFQVHESEAFIPFIWMVSRFFNVGVLILGASIFLLGGAAAGERERTRGKGFITFISIVFIAGAVAVVYAVASREALPTMIHADKLIHRPWDLIPLALFLFAGAYILPTFSKWHPTYFSRALLVSIIPHVAAQLYMIFGSSALYDGGFNIACALKALAYFVPLHGLREDYRETYRLEQEDKQALANELLMHEQASHALARDRGLLHALMEHLPEAIYVKDASLRYLRVNHNQAHKLGLTHPFEAVGRKVTDFPSNGDGAVEQAQDQEVLATGREVGGKVPLRGPEGQVLGVVGILDN